MQSPKSLKICVLISSGVDKILKYLHEGQLTLQQQQQQKKTNLAKQDIKK